MNRKPLIAHVLYRLDTGGVERMLATLISRTRPRYHHAVITLVGGGGLRQEIEGTADSSVSLDKKPGKDPACYFRLWKTLRKLRPDLVHTYNVGALDAAPVAKFAGVRRIVHAERGRDVSDPVGQSRKYRMLRRWLEPFIDRYVVVSGDLRDWLVNTIGINPSRVAYIANGVDVAEFAPCATGTQTRPMLGSFAPPGTILFGTVGRLDPVKDQAGLITTFKRLCESSPEMRGRLRLAIVGEGPQHKMLQARIDQLGLAGQVRLLGNRDDVPSLLAEFDVFVLSSIAEGMPGAVLQAMATGLPVVGTKVGGVPELVLHGTTGLLVPASDPLALAEAMSKYVSGDELRLRHGTAGRQRVVAKFGLDEMIASYTSLYDELLGQPTPAVTRSHSMNGITSDEGP